MVKFGVGSDIQKIDEFVSIEDNFIKRVYSNLEADYCRRKSKPAQHFAARFAAKEAVIKAFSQFGEKINYDEVEIVMNSGKPCGKITSRLKDKYDLNISMSHSGEYALGFALVKNEKN